MLGWCWRAHKIAYFLSVNHDAERFEIIASGHVDEEGRLIHTDPGGDRQVDRVDRLFRPI